MMIMAPESKTIANNSPLIYGLDYECRALCSQYSEYLPSRFFIGTQSLKADENQVHLLEYVEDCDHLAKAVFRHRLGEIWHLLAFSKQPHYLFTCHSKCMESNRMENFYSLWKIPIDLSQSLNENENSTLLDLTNVSSFEKSSFDENLGRMARLKPDEENELLLMLETKLAHLDLETKNLINYITVDHSASQKNANRLSKISTFNWSPHFNANIVAIVVNNNIHAQDLRSNADVWTISQAHSQTVRDVDFNPNSQYYIATCGDDCAVKFWDVRNTTKPVLKMLHHSHWVWAVRYNSFHDHLVLSSSSDGNVNLLKTCSIASQPYGQLIDEDLDEEDPSLKRLLMSEQSKQADGLIRTFEDHADSVYRIEWSPNDPWIFASLSYDGRLILNKVPEEEKINVMG